MYHNTRGIARHFSLLRFSAGEVKKGPKPAPLSGRKVTLERRRNIGKEPDTAIPLCPGQPNNTNSPRELWNIGNLDDHFSVRLDVGYSDHLAPLLSFFRDKPAELGGRHRHWNAAEVCESFLDL